MLLLYQVPVELLVSSLTDLHSTMLLLYQRKNETMTRYILIYIPLCFYFIWTITTCRSTLTYLHSTMLLLYLFRGSGPLTLCKNLHSTMLLLYPGDIKYVARGYKIYIPLCFYFILKQDKKTGRFGNLHSTMLLLYLVSGR